MTSDDVRKVIRSQKKRLKKSFKQLSRDSGVAESTIYNYMYGQRGISLELVEPVLNAMGLELCIRRKQE